MYLALCSFEHFEPDKLIKTPMVPILREYSLRYK